MPSTQANLKQQEYKKHVLAVLILGLGSICQSAQDAQQQSEEILANREMGVSIRIERLLKGLQDDKSATGVAPRRQSHYLDPNDGVEDIFQREGHFSPGTEAGTSEQGTPRSSLLLATADDSVDMFTPSCSDSARILLQDEITKLVKQLGDSRVRVATLESQLELLKQEKNDQQTQHDHQIKQLETQLLQLERQAEVDVAELEQRQNLIEFEMPALEAQLKSLKDVLRDLNISEPLYAELLAVPEDRRSLRDHILVLAYERMQSFRQEQENLRVERDTSREALIRANDEVEKLQREVQRTIAVATSQKKEMEKEVEAMVARSERLETDLKDAIVQVQVLSAKGALYDEVKEDLDRCKKILEIAERDKMISETAAKTLTEEKQRFLEVIKDKDHTLELLRMDKAYLSREVKVQEDMVKKLELEKERQQEKIRDLKRSKQDLYDRVVLGSQESHTAQEERLQSELLRVQDQARHEIEEVRRGAAEAASRELQLLREMRDAALADVDKAQTALQESRTAYEELLLKYNEAQRLCSARDTDARSEIKMKQFELDRLHVLYEESKSLLTRAKIENEALTQKLKVLTEKYHDLEMEMEKQVIQLQNVVGGELKHGLPKDRTSNETVTGQGTSESSKEGIWVQKLAAAVTVIVQRQLQKMEAKCLELQNAVKAAEDENTELMLELKEKRTEEAGIVTRTMQHMDPVQLVDRIVMAETKSQELLGDRNALEAALREARRERDRVTHSLQKLKEDLRRLLQARGSIEDLQKLIAEKGSNVREEVMNRFSTLKSLESCTKCI